MPKAPVKKYRMLRKGEIIKSTDEGFSNDVGPWQQIKGLFLDPFLGDVCNMHYDPEILVPMRREVKPKGKKG
jgi:hypothetical protein